MDINNFGIFKADVWGTVSDWAMIVVTGVTAWFLYKTLQSQQIVQTLQNELITIEKFKHRINIMPKFTLEIAVKQYSLNDDIMTLPFDFKVKNNKNLALNAVFTIVDEKEVLKKLSNPYKYDKVQPETFFLFSNALVDSVNFSNGQPFFWIAMDMTIEYEDIDGNKYLQKFTNLIGKDDKDSMAIPYEPELLTT